MIDRSMVAAWVDSYVRAWNSNDAADIVPLFSDNARYYHSPFAQAWTGREAIVRNWLARQDAPGSTTFRYEVLATTEHTGIVRAWTEYVERGQEFSNIWLIRFDADGLCEEFTEWWMQRDA